MADTAIALSPTTAFLVGSQTVAASAPLFATTDVGRALSIRGRAPARAAATAYATGVVFVSSYAGIDRLYRVIVAGTTATGSDSGTTPSYDLNAPREIGATVTDGTAVLKYLGQGRHCWGWSTIVGFTDDTHVTVSVDSRGPFVSTTGSTRWRLGEFSPMRGYPRCMTIHKGRTWWGGTSAKPQTLWASNSADYENMAPSEPDGTVLDTNAITITLDDDEVNTVQWLSTFTRGLAVGTASGEHIVKPANANGALSPNNIQSARETDRGSQPAVARQRVSGVILFVERGGRKVRQLEYDFGTDTFATIDLTELADDITGYSVLETAYQRKPDGILWAVLTDGSIATLTFDREQKVRAWTRQVLGGVDAKVESVCVVPSPDGTTDDVYLSVARTVGGSTVRTIEFVRAPYRSDIDGATGGFFVDCGLTYTGTAATTFAGLGHLEGQIVAIVGDGAVRDMASVTAGAVTATGPASTVAHIGLPYLHRVMTLPLEAGAAAGTAQGQLKRISELTIRFLDSASGRYGRPGNMEQVVLRHAGDAMSRAVPLFTGDKRVKFPANYDRAGQIAIEGDDPLPTTVLALIADTQTNG